MKGAQIPAALAAGASGLGRSGRGATTSALGFGAARPVAPSEPGQEQAGAAKVAQIGSKTFYWKKDRWTDSSVTQEEAEKATVMTQFSDDYFQLARVQKAENNQYLSLDEPVTVKLNGKVYRIDPVKKDASR